MRCFIGLPMPQDYQQGLQRVTAAWQDRLRSRLSWTRPGNWHLTLKFFGEVHEEFLDALIQILHHPMGDRFVLQAGGRRGFPRTLTSTGALGGFAPRRRCLPRSGQGSCAALRGNRLFDGTEFFCIAFDHCPDQASQVRSLDPGAAILARHRVARGGNGSRGALGKPAWQSGTKVYGCGGICFVLTKPESTAGDGWGCRN